MMDRDILGEVLSELVVEESTTDGVLARDALREAHNLSFELAQLLSQAADSLPVGETRTAVRNLQTEQGSLLRSVGEVLRGGKANEKAR